MDFNTYQKKAKETAVYPSTVSITYPVLGLCGEAGEVAEIIKKALRSEQPFDTNKLMDEMGDVLWYLAALASDLRIQLSDVAERNIRKLANRKEEGTLKERSNAGKQGSGVS